MERENNSSMKLEADKELTYKMESCCWIGKIILEIPLDKRFVKNITCKIWKCKRDFTVSNVEKNMFMFCFEDKDDWVKALCNAPAIVNGGLLILCPWSSGQVLSDLHFSHSPFWVQIHGLPPDYMTEDNGLKIGKDLGIPICVDKNMIDGKISWGKFLRIRVIIDVSNPLKTGFKLERGGLFPIWVDFKYEKLAQFCYNCGRIGHVYRTCKFGSSSVKFGPCLRAVSLYVPSSYFGSKSTVVNRRSITVDGGLVSSMAASEQSLVMQVCPRMDTGKRHNQSEERYLWQKLTINSVDSMAMAMNCAIIYLRAYSESAYESNRRLIIAMGCYLFYLVLKLIREIQRSWNFKVYNVRVPLAELGVMTLVELFIFLMFFLMLF